MKYVRIFVIVYFQLLKTSLKLRKREFDWPIFFVGPIRDFFSSVKKKENKYSYFKIFPSPKSGIRQGPPVYIAGLYRKCQFLFSNLTLVKLAQWILPTFEIRANNWQKWTFKFKTMYPLRSLRSCPLTNKENVKNQARTWNSTSYGFPG